MPNIQFILPYYLILINFFKIFIINSFVMLTSLKFSNLLNNSLKNKIIFIVINIVFSLFISFLSSTSSTFYTAPLIILFSIALFFIVNRFNFFHSLLTTFISLSINFIFYLLALIICYSTCYIFNINNSVISFLLIFISYFLMINALLHSRRLKYGLTYINKYKDDLTLDIIILNLSSILLLLFIILPQIDFIFSSNIVYIFLIFAVIMSATIYKSFSLYYKHNLLVKELNDTKLELEKKDKEIERLEKENLEFSKTSHSIAHKQRVLEYKLNQLQLNTEFANELDLSDKLKEISDTYSSNVTNLTLPKTGIENIDDILEYMQLECTKNNINFELQLNGDIFSMVTTVINKEKLEILLADHIKNAIIAINSSENINKSILVRLGLINNIYSIYFYDSGIEFDEKVLSSLGKEQITTHKDIGGTGCGFLNTFDTLKEFNASLEINEISAPCKDNYTKSIVIKFDGKNDFTINSYKKQE